MSYILYRELSTPDGDKRKVYYTGKSEDNVQLFSEDESKAKRFEKWREIILLILQLVSAFLTMTNIKYKKI